MKKIILFFLAAGCVSLSLSAETIKLKSGQSVEGKIIERSESSIKLEMEGITLTYFLDQIESVDGKSLGSSVTTPEKPVPAGTSPDGNSGNATVSEKQPTLGDAGGSSKSSPEEKMSDIQDYLKQAVSYIANKQYDQASEELNKVLELDPQLAQAHQIFGYLHMASGKYEEAVESYKKALTIDPQYTEAYVGLADVYTALDRPDEALLNYQKAMDIKPESIEALRGVGFAYNALGKYTEAIAAFKKVLALEPNYAQAYAGLGFAYAFSGQYEEAKRNLLKAKVMFKQEERFDEVQKIDSLLTNMP
ncbi:MAG: tetratricopeptide repeat protein [Candidatus Omnitrophica bacterium]|nr:tetratricopeptide repeat protein [Candidatus Omnitrophota bacterium]